jgi:hypothetical protein
MVRAAATDPLDAPLPSLLKRFSEGRASPDDDLTLVWLTRE